MRIIVAIAIALFAGSLDAAEPDSNAALQKLFDDEWEYGLRESPTFASHLGDKRYNDRWPDVSLEAIARRQAHQRELLERLKQFDAARLSAEDRLNERLFRWQAELDVEGQPLGWHLVPINQREGIQDEGSLGDSLSFDTVKDYEDWLQRIERFPVYMDQTIGLLQEGLKRGILQPQIVLQRIPSRSAGRLLRIRNRACSTSRSGLFQRISPKPTGRGCRPPPERPSHGTSSRLIRSC